MSLPTNKELLLTPPTFYNKGFSSPIETNHIPAIIINEIIF
jgi:hypothetical protein